MFEKDLQAFKILENTSCGELGVETMQFFQLVLPPTMCHVITQDRYIIGIMGSSVIEHHT